MSKSTLTKEQAYHAYVTYQETTESPVVAFESFDEQQQAQWQKVADTIYSFWAVPEAQQAAA